MPRSVGERLAKEARRQLRRAGVAVNVDPEDLRGTEPCLGVHLVAVLGDDTQVGFSFLCEKGTPAEKAARRVVNFLFAWLDSGAALPQHLADQVLLPLALAREPSVFTTSRVTRHLLTNADVIMRFLPTRIRIEGREGRQGEVQVIPA
jgi:RNA 3'-terminal phosphate cyclase (ATP)